MDSIVETVILGVIQGLTEWLPVSSSGHLALASEFFDWTPPTIFYVLLHLSTLLVIVAFFRKDIWEVLRALVRGDFKSEAGKLGVYVVVGSIPTAVIGFAFRDLFESFFNNLIVSLSVSLVSPGLPIIIYAPVLMPIL